MKNIYTLLSTFATLGLLLTTQSTLASGSRIELNIGQASYPSEDFSESEALNNISINQDTSPLSWSFTYGYEITDYLALQVGYYDLGEYTIDSRSNEAPRDQYPSNTSIDIHGYSLALVPQFSLSEKLSFILELGMHSYSGNTSNVYPSFVDGEFDTYDRENEKSSGEELFYSAGLRYDINEKVYTGLKYGQFEFEFDNVDNFAAMIGLRF